MPLNVFSQIYEKTIFGILELFSPSAKNKKIHYGKISYTLSLKNFLHFLKRKLSLYFRT